MFKNIFKLTVLMMIMTFGFQACDDDSSITGVVDEPVLIGCGGADLYDWSSLNYSDILGPDETTWVAFEVDSLRYYSVLFNTGGFECDIYDKCNTDNTEVGDTLLMSFISVENQVLALGPVNPGDYLISMHNTRNRAEFNFTIIVSDIVYGCTDSDAENYDIDANYDIGTCVYPLIPGCIDELACNYNPLAEEDDGSCVLVENNYDCDGNCVVDLDCNGQCGGTSVIDQCNICGGDNSSCSDCVGVVDGNAYTDGCGDCVGGSTGIPACANDCAGTPGGNAQFDNCGICDSDESNNCEPDCFGQWGGTSVVDSCGQCGGNGEDHECWNGDLVCFPNECSAPPISGCTDPEAINYNPTATVDDETCDYQVCPQDWIPDCNGNCAPTNWIGDNFCDDGGYSVTNPDTGETYTVYLNCAEFNNDGGDCDTLERNNSTPPVSSGKIKTVR